jgi:hypothetical protein
LYAGVPPLAETDNDVELPRSNADGVAKKALMDNGAGFTWRGAVAVKMFGTESAMPTSIMKEPVEVGVHVSDQEFVNDTVLPLPAHPLVPDRSL